MGFFPSSFCATKSTSYSLTVNFTAAPYPLTPVRTFPVVQSGGLLPWPFEHQLQPHQETLSPVLYTHLLRLNSCTSTACKTHFLLRHLPLVILTPLVYLTKVQWKYSQDKKWMKESLQQQQKHPYRPVVCATTPVTVFPQAVLLMMEQYPNLHKKIRDFKRSF